MIFEDKFVGRPVKIGKSAKHYTRFLLVGASGVRADRRAAASPRAFSWTARPPCPSTCLSSADRSHRVKPLKAATIPLIETLKTPSRRDRFDWERPCPL